MFDRKIDLHNTIKLYELYELLKKFIEEIEVNVYNPRIKEIKPIIDSKCFEPGNVPF